MKTKGFTLIEIAIVLVIIGLLAGGILKGQQMIENSKFKAWVKQIDGIRVAFNAYQDRYKALPGDDVRAVSRFGSTTFNGNGDGQIYGPGGAIGAGNEPENALQQLILAGFLMGDGNPGTGNQIVITPQVGGELHYIETRSANVVGLAFKHWIFWWVPAASAKRLDNEFDDGRATSGDVVIAETGFTGTEWPTDDQFVRVATAL